jgi:hypothetical protein
MPEEKVTSPKRGGTFFYCTWTERKQVGSAVEVSSCGMTYSRYVGSRFGTAAAYRRHRRRTHS